MRIKTLALKHFRNFQETQAVEFPKASLLIAAAPNATGKTNFLESIVTLLRGKSFRAQMEDCVQWGEEMFEVRGLLEYQNTEADLVVRYHTPSKKLRIEEGGIPVSPVTFYSHYPFVLFLPEDTFMFYRGPAMRRNFLNTSLSASPHYLSAVVQYQRTLRQRNAALKEAREPDEIVAWTDLLVEYASVVWNHREALVKYLNSQAPTVFQSLFGEDYDVDVQLVPGASSVDRFAELLTSSWQYEKKYQYTLYGPHRDDIKIMINDRPAQAVLSRGQMRSLVISLKVAVYGFIKRVSGQEPLMLFDEVLSELDEERQRILLEKLPETQVILTCTTIPPQMRRHSGAHMLDLGSITRDDVSVPETSPPTKESTNNKTVVVKEEIDGEVEIVQEDEEEIIPIRS